MPSHSFVIESVNYINDDLWQAFQNFYALCISTRGLVEYYNRNLPTDLVIASHNFFQELKKVPGNSTPDVGKMADCYFENFTPIWNLSGQRNKALMYVVFDMVRRWEKQNDFFIHKGTLFYFWATTDIIHGDYDEGIILMHKALEEDRRKSGGVRSPDTPAHDFVSLNEKMGAYLQPITQDMVDFIKRRLNRYNKEVGDQLQYAKLRSNFLDSTDVKFEDLKFYFSYTILKWRRLGKIYKQRNIADIKMAPLIITGLISDLLLVIDGIYKIAFESRYQSNNGNIHFSNHLFEVAKKYSWTQTANFGSYMNEKGKNINNEIKSNFNTTVKELLDSKIGLTKIDKIEADFWLCYGLRNFSAHTIESQKFIWDEFTEILQSLLNVFYLGVKNL